MNLLDFARGPALDVAIAIFLFGVAWRLLSLWLLPHAVDRSVARADAPSGFSARVSGFMRHMTVPKDFKLSTRFAVVNGYVFHIGLAIVVFGYAQHILFIKGITGLSWPGLPTGLINLIGVITLASLIAALVRRINSPV